MDTSPDPPEQEPAGPEDKTPKDRSVRKLERKIQKQAELLADLMTDADQLGLQVEVQFFSSKVYELDLSEKKGTFSMQRTHKNRFYPAVSVTEKEDPEPESK